MTPKQQAVRTVRARAISRELRKLFPNARIALQYRTPWELLVAVVLSAQCTDSMVNRVTKTLFAKYPSFRNYVRVKRSVFERDIRPTGFYRNKAKNILRTAAMIEKRFGGKIPRTMGELLTLPGVARKTANVVLGNAFGVVEGIAVDTHVRRFAIKFNLTDYRDPVRIEKDLMTIFPKSEWFRITYRLIEYGRKICPARRHECATHPLTKLYPPSRRRWPRPGM